MAMTDKERFIEHLTEASAEVATWPPWKRNCLGVIAVETKPPPPDARARDAQLREMLDRNEASSGR